MEDDKEGETLTIQKAFACYEVQRTITQYLSFKDLKSLRLVNKDWMRCALVSLKDKSQVVLDSPQSFQDYITFLETSSLCFSNYHVIIKPEKFGGIIQVKDLFDKFWNLCFDGAAELSILTPWTCAYSLLHCIYYQNPEEGRCSLEKLSLNLVDVEKGNENWSEESFGSDDNENEALEQTNTRTNINSLILFSLNVSIVLNSEKKVFPFTWTEFFHASPNVCHLSIQSDYASGHFYKIVHVLVEREMRLKTLKIGTRDQRLFSDEFLRKLRQLITRETTTLSLGFLPSVQHDSPLDSIVLQAAPSLRHLTFLQIRTSNQATLSCFTSSDAHMFPNLTSIRITKELVPNLNFLVKMPKIKRLEIYRDSTIGQHDVLSSPIIRTRTLPVIYTLQSLVLEPFIPEDHVWKLVRWFPNLQRLQMKANDVIARIIFMSWKNLKELYLIAEITRDNNDIVRSSLTDEGITGFSREFLQQQNISSEGVTEVGEISVNRDRTAFIGNLEKLESCKLQAVPDYQTGITDFSIYLGFMNMPALLSLTLVKTLVSPVAADHLRKHGVSVTVSKY